MSEGVVYRIVVGGDNGKVKILSIDIPSDHQSGSTLELAQTSQKLLGHTARIHGLCYLSDKQWIVSGSSDETIKIWNATKQSVKSTLLQTLSITNEGILCLCNTPDNTRIIIATNAKSFQIWNTLTLKLDRKWYFAEEKSINDHTNYVKTICCSPNNKQFASGSFDKMIKIWDIETGKLVHTLLGHTDAVYSACYSPDNKYTYIRKR